MVLNVVIIGGGISGSAAAYDLARRGAAVTLLERAELASMASGWTLAGVRQSGRHPAELPLARSAVERWTTLDHELDADTEYRQDGNLRLALNSEDIPAIADVVSVGNAHGIAVEYIEGAAEIQRIAPAITHEVAAASLCATDGHANPTKTVQAFGQAANRAGATIVTGCEVTEILTAQGTVTGVKTANGSYPAEVVVVAAGVYTARLLSPLGLELPIEIVHVPVLQTVPLPPTLSQVLGVATGTFSGRQEVSGRFRLIGRSIPWIGTTHTAENVLPSLDQVRETIELSTRILPGLTKVRVNRVWGGLIDRTPDSLPVIERSAEVEGLIVAAGFSGHGFCLGPITGSILADLALTGTTPRPIAPFALDRFAHQPQATTAMELHG